MSDRDPRRDPEPGDVIEKGMISRTVVSANNALDVSFTRRDYKGESTHRVQLATWRAWCRAPSALVKWQREWDA